MIDEASIVYSILTYVCLIHVDECSFPIELIFQIHVCSVFSEPLGFLFVISLWYR